MTKIFENIRYLSRNTTTKDIPKIESSVSQLGTGYIISPCAVNTLNEIVYNNELVYLFLAMSHELAKNGIPTPTIYQLPKRSKDKYSGNLGIEICLPSQSPILFQYYQNGIRRMTHLNNHRGNYMYGIVASSWHQIINDWKSASMSQYDNVLFDRVIIFSSLSTRTSIYCN